MNGAATDLETAARGESDRIAARETDLRCRPARTGRLINRREFCQRLGGGIVVLLFAPRALAQESGRRGRGRQRPSELSAWLHIGGDGTVTVFTGKVEVGQNTRTTLTQIVAEELRVPVSAIQLVMGDTDRVPFDAGTFGSRSTPDMGAQLRQVSASAREALLDLAAVALKADRAGLVIADGRVAQPGSGESIGFGELTRGQQLVREIDAAAPTTSVEHWRVAGTSVPKVGGALFVTGRHRYTSDLTRPGLLHGKVLRPPAFEARLVSVDLTTARAVDGVTVVHDGEFVGVVASDPQLAQRAIEAVHAEWKTEPQRSQAELFAWLKSSARGSSGRGGVESGVLSDGLAQAAHTFRRQFTVAYIAHAPLEPRAAVAEWRDGRLTVWTGTQRPFGVRGELAEAFGVSEEQVRVIVPDTGSGYGGKHSGEAAVEAASLAKAAGRPVKLVWTREEEFHWAYFRPAGVIEIESGVRADGTICAWEFHNYNSGPSGIRCPYEVPNQKIAFHPSQSPLRQGSYRGLAAVANHFAREVQIDEMAQAVNLDPLEFRMRNLKDERLRAVLAAAAEKFGWASARAVKGRGIGLAASVEKGSYVGTCVEVSVERAGGAVKVERVAVAFECGAVVNPAHLENQIEGSIVMGLGGALFEAVTFENGKILNPRFSAYRVPRFSDAPRIEVVLVNRPDLPSAGAGETPIVGIAPAIANAIHAATGVRLRALPLAPQGVKTGQSAS